MDNTDKLVDLLVDMLTKAAMLIEKGGDIAATELPKFIEQLLTWHIVSGLLWFVFSLVAIVVSVAVIVKLWKKPTDYNGTFSHYGGGSSSDFDAALAIIIALVVILPCTICAVVCLMDVIKILVAPNVWLLDYVRTCK